MIMDVKEKKLLKQNDMGIAEDRISNLPQKVLLHILSFLHMKRVVATSILSTKWKYLWKLVSCLDFGNSSEYKGDDYVRRAMNSVDRVFLFRDLSNVTKFILSSDFSWDDSRVNAWISSIIRYKLKELILSIPIFLRDSSILPPSVFLCESLTVLKISYDGIVKVPSSISFPSLKTLELEYLKFSDGHLTENFSSCPVLEVLIIKKCEWVGILSKVSISNTALKRLIIECSEKYEKVNDINYLKMHAPSLVFLSWVSEYLPIECNLSDMPSLVSANVVFKKAYENKTKEEVGLVASNLLGVLSHVKSLKISAQIVTYAKDVSDHIQEFGNLLKLEVVKDCDYVSTSSLLLLPRISPHLENILFKGDRPYFGEVKEDWKLDAVPKSCLLHLKKVVYSELMGDPVELALVKYLVENAVVMEEMKINVHWELDQAKGKRSKVLEHLLRMRRGSNRCIIDIR